MTKRIASLFLLVAIGGVLLVVTPRRAGADPNNANCKPNRAACTANHQCCSGTCTAGLCAAPPTTTSTTTTSTTVTTSTTTTSTTTSTTTTTLMAGCPLPATGQTTCWDSSGNVIPCAGTGHDGDTLK